MTNKGQNIDYSRLVCGTVYGTNSRTIYENCCDALGWDKSQANQFGRQGAPLFATYADANRKRNVWFITYYTFVEEKPGNGNHVVNIIRNDGNNITEIVDERWGFDKTQADRIVFIKTKNGYEFLGVYNMTKNGYKREYQRIGSTFTSYILNKSDNSRRPFNSKK